VSVGAEVGDVELLGRRRAEGLWEFRRIVNDSSWAILDEEMDPDANPPVIVPTWVPLRASNQIIGRNSYPSHSCYATPSAVAPYFAPDGKQVAKDMPFHDRRRGSARVLPHSPRHTGH
jgi:hypothetical protein